jgi:hypothetical protein
MPSWGEIMRRPAKSGRLWLLVAREKGRSQATHLCVFHARNELCDMCQRSVGRIAAVAVLVDWCTAARLLLGRLPLQRKWPLSGEYSV